MIMDKIRCITCQKFIKVESVVAKCMYETIYELECGHERHIRRKKIDESPV